METKRILRKAVVVVMAVFLFSGLAEATIIDVCDGTFEIESGDEYTAVDVWNEANVTMIGGIISTRLTLHDESMFIANGGSIGNGTDIAVLEMSQLHLHLLEFPVSHRVWTEGDNAKIHVYGYGFEYVPSSADWILNGYWANHSGFSILLRGPYTKPNVTLHEIPEPSTIAFLGIGTLLMRSNTIFKEEKNV